MEMTVTRGLKELKTLDSRIQKAIMGIKAIAVVEGDRTVLGYDSNEKFQENARSSRDSIASLIKRRNEIKTAIVDSNAKTKVKIGSKEMTRAEAIDRKDSIKYEIMFLNQIKSQRNSALADFNNKSERLKDKVDQLVETAFGKDKKVSAEDYDNIAKPYKKQNEIKLIDPLGLRELIDKLDAEIDEFQSEVDFVLSESNSTTHIEISDN